MKISKTHILELVVLGIAFIACMQLIISGLSFGDSTSDSSNKTTKAECTPTSTPAPITTTPMVATPTPTPKGAYDFTIAFAGDINFSEGWSSTTYMDTKRLGISDCIGESLLKRMREADFMCLNNEFTYGDIKYIHMQKPYTFRANTKRVRLLKRLGVDAVMLANNHVYDYYDKGLLSTFETLERAGIPYFGAGRNMEEASAPYYVTIQGKTIAFVSALACFNENSEELTKEATEDGPGVLRCNDPTLFLEVIKEAKAHADYVIACPHWGAEYTTVLTAEQLKGGKLFIDAGADFVIGGHPHCLQGIEYYNGKPIFYSLGNYWFNSSPLDTMLLELHFTGDDNNSNIECKIIPAKQENTETHELTNKKDIDEFFRYMESISVGDIKIDKNGIVCSK